MKFSAAELHVIYTSLQTAICSYENGKVEINKAGINPDSKNRINAIYDRAIDKARSVVAKMNYPNI